MQIVLLLEFRRDFWSMHLAKIEFTNPSLPYGDTKANFALAAVEKSLEHEPGLSNEVVESPRHRSTLYMNSKTLTSSFVQKTIQL